MSNPWSTTITQTHPSTPHFQHQGLHFNMVFEGEEHPLYHFLFLSHLSIPQQYFTLQYFLMDYKYKSPNMLFSSLIWECPYSVLPFGNFFPKSYLRYTFSRRPFLIFSLAVNTQCQAVIHVFYATSCSLPPVNRYFFLFLSRLFSQYPENYMLPKDTEYLLVETTVCAILSY